VNNGCGDSQSARRLASLIKLRPLGVVDAKFFGEAADSFVDDNAHVVKAILKHVAPCLGRR
jgi:hypothetical protein